MFEDNDADVGWTTIMKPYTPMVDKVVQEATFGDDSKMVEKL